MLSKEKGMNTLSPDPAEQGNRTPVSVEAGGMRLLVHWQQVLLVCTLKRKPSPSQRMAHPWTRPLAVRYMRIFPSPSISHSGKVRLMPCLEVKAPG